MHYHVELHIDPEDWDFDKFDPDVIDNNWVFKKMSGFHYEHSTAHNPFTFDWCQVGGRWKGAHIKDYDPEKDFDHKEKCSLCGGTGRRVGMDGCNGCRGTGIAIKWPTQWRRHDQDIMRVEDLDDELTCYCLIVNGFAYVVREFIYVPDGESYYKDGPLANKTIKQMLNELDITTGYLITVDCHN